MQTKIPLMSTNAAGSTFQILGLMQIVTTLFIQCIILPLFVIGWVITKSLSTHFSERKSD